MTDHAALAAALADLGWSAVFAAQLGPADAGLEPRRVAGVHRSRIAAVSAAGPVELALAPATDTGAFAVGDFVLAEPGSERLVRRLERRTVLERRVEGSRTPQLAAANVDTLFVVTSCNADFNPARLERYLALANQAGTVPVILLTKADTVPDAGRYRAEAEALQRGLAVVAINSKAPEAAAQLAPWCGPGQTVALIGSSGVGKSTLTNTLAGPAAAAAQATGGIREADAKGRHTTTARSLHRVAGGGWVIDTPGMRTLHLANVTAGIDMVFAEIAELAPLCRFRDCTHAHEPGCAVGGAVAAGTLDPRRLARWRKLGEENRDNTPVPVGARGNRSLVHPGRRRP